MTIDRLKGEGHTLVPFEVTLEEMDQLSYAYVGFAKHSAIPNFNKLEKDRYEYVMPFYKKFLILTALPNFLRRFVSWALGKFTSEQRLAKRVAALLDKDHDGISDLYLRFNKFRELFDNKWSKAGIDALVSPCSFHCAFKIESAEELSTIHDYYYLFNFIHYPAGVVPVTQVQADESTGSYIQDTGRRWTDQVAQKIQSSELGSEGMPLCVQVVTQQWKDEECVAVMKIVDDLMGNFRVPLPDFTSILQ